MEYAVAAVAGAATLAFTFRGSVRSSFTPAAEGQARSAATKCSIDEYESKAITDTELKKLQATPEFQRWLSSNADRIVAREEAVVRREFLLGLSLMIVATVAVLALPFATFDANGPTLNALLARLPQPRGGGTLVLLGITLFCFVLRSLNAKLVLLCSAVGVVLACDAIKLGLGFCVFIGAVATKTVVLD